MPYLAGTGEQTTLGPPLAADDVIPEAFLTSH
jgi:hypothetical protein